MRKSMIFQVCFHQEFLQSDSDSSFLLKYWVTNIDTTERKILNNLFSLAYNDL